MDNKKIKTKKLGEIDDIFYKLGLGGLVVCIVCAIVYAITGFSVLHIKYPCVFKITTGLWCPGCGGTRAVLQLLHGNIFQSFIDHPVVIYGTIVYIVFMVRCFLIKHFGNNGRFKSKKDGAIIPFIYVGIGIMLIQWIIKLVALIAYNVSWIR